MSETSRLRQFPWGVLACVGLLLLLGVSGIARGDELRGGDYASRQVAWIALAVPAMLLVTWPSYRLCRHHAYAWFVVCLVCLVVVYAFPPKGGARRWIPLGILNFQPSEAMKLAYIIGLARYLMFRENYRRLSGLMAPFVLTLIPLVLILKEPDLGTSLLFLPVLFAMLFAAGARWKHLLLVAVCGVAVLPALWSVMHPYQKARITSLFLQQDGGPAPTGDGYHQHQAKQVLALGGPYGSYWSGLAVDDPLAYHLPAGRTDFVLCMIGERWGLLGTSACLGLFLLLFAQGLWIAMRTRDPFGRLLAVGVVALLAGQTLLNSGMTVGLMPVTGVTLPLLSYGGSSLLFTCISLGLLMNVALRPDDELSREPFRFAKA